MASAATKIGTVAFSDRRDAGVDLRLAPRDERERHRGVDGAEEIAGFAIFRISLQALCQPWRATSNPMSGIADRASRKPIVVVGSSSSTATLMNMKEEPHSAASTSRSGT